MKNSIFLLGLFVILSAGSCRKVKGCTDPLATNYNAEAEKEDESCIYNNSGDLSFWFNESRSISLIGSGVTTLTVFIDDVSYGTIDPSEWAVGPECFGENRFTTSIVIGNTDAKLVSYEINDQSGGTRFDGSVTVTANVCTSTQLPE